MRKTLMLMGLLYGWVSPLSAQRQAADPIEIPLRVEDGRLMVSVDAPGGTKFDFILTLGIRRRGRRSASAMSGSSQLP